MMDEAGPLPHQDYILTALLLQKKMPALTNIPFEGIARVFIRDWILSITTVGSRQSLNWKNNSGAV